MTAAGDEPDLWEVTFKRPDGSEWTVEVSSVNVGRAERRARLRFAKQYPQEAFVAPVVRVKPV